MSSEEDVEVSGRGRAVAVLALETGGCGACAQSVAALQSPRYRAKLAAHCITFVHSPRHADVVLLSGPGAAQAEQSVRRVLDLVTEPQALVAVGDCAINGCVFSGGTDLSHSVAESLDVHIELPGCPPTPASILNALVRAAQLLDESQDEEESDTETDEPDDDVEETGNQSEDADGEPDAAEAESAESEE